MSVTQIAKQQLLVFILLLILIAGLVAASIALRTSTETRRPAAVPNGPGTITLSGGNTFTINTSATIDLESTLQNIPVDGFQVVANFTGDIPLNIWFEPQTPTGLELAYNSMINTSGGKQLKLAYVTANPQAPIQTPQNIHLGAITFKALSTGSMTIAFDPTQSIITQNQTTQDILTYPQSATYTFLAPSPSPSPSPSCSFQTPEVSLTPTTQSGAPGQTLEYQLSIYNRDPANCSPSNFNISTGQPTNWSGEVESTPVSISPQSTGLTLLYFTSGISTTAGGSHPVAAIASRTINNQNQTYYASAYYQVLDIPPSPSPSPSPAGEPSPSPSPLPTCLAADINKDGIVDNIDRSVLLKDTLRTPPFDQRSDINGNGTVDVIDYSLLVTSYNKTTGPCQ